MNLALAPFPTLSPSVTPSTSRHIHTLHPIINDVVYDDGNEFLFLILNSSFTLLVLFLVAYNDRNALGNGGD